MTRKSAGDGDTTPSSDGFRVITVMARKPALIGMSASSGGHSSMVMRTARARSSAFSSTASLGSGRS
jgi:hypothetical protein